MEYILAIDQGTTGSRAIVYDKIGRKIASAYEEFPQYFPKPGWVEHDPQEIWQSVFYSIQNVLGKIPGTRVCAIGITNQRETTVVWDRVTGTPAYKAIVWQCRRTSLRCNELKSRKKMAQFFKEKTGLPIDAYFSATKLEWILKNIPGAGVLAKQGRLCFGTIDTWVLWKLTGGRVYATDYTNASRTMLFNIETRVWDKEILKLFKISKVILPEVKKSSGNFGVTAKIGNLPSGIPVSGIAGDQQAALFGQGCVAPGTMKNTYGTGSFILCNTGLKRVVSRYGLITTLGCGASGEPVYALEGAVFVAGAAIQWLRDKLKLLRVASESEKIALSVKDNGGVYFVPALVGLGAPYWDSECRGALFGITRGTQSSHVVRAALEAMCYQARDVVEAMQKDSGLKIKALKVDGGAAANNFLCQFQADILGIDVVRPRVIEVTSLGAAYLAGLAVGYWKNAQELKKCWIADRVFSPRMPRSRASELYQGWREAVSRTLSNRVNY